MRQISVIFVVLLLFCSCSILVPLAGRLAGECPTYDTNYASYSDYVVQVNATTSEGTPVDTSGAIIDLSAIDSAADRLEKCLDAMGPHEPLRHCGFTVKIATDIEHHSGGSESFTCGSNQCAGWSQPPNVVIVPDNLWALDHEILHVIGYQHQDPQFQCQ